MVGLHVFFNDTATTEIYTLSLHDALPISPAAGEGALHRRPPAADRRRGRRGRGAVHPGRQLDPQDDQGGSGEVAVLDRKSTRLNSSHANISYAVFCLKKTIAATADDRSDQ